MTFRSDFVEPAPDAQDFMPAAGEEDDAALKQAEAAAGAWVRGEMRPWRPT